MKIALQILPTTFDLLSLFQKTFIFIIF